MKTLPSDTLEEFEYRLKWGQNRISALSPEQAISKRKSDAYLGYGSSHFNKGVNLLVLDRISEAQEYFSQVIPNYRLSIAHSLKENETNERQYCLFFASLLLGDKKQSDESALIITKTGVKPIQMLYHSVIYVAFAHLYLQQTKSVMNITPEIKKLEEHKNIRYVLPGITNAIKGICERNEALLIEGLTTMLDKHRHIIRYTKWALSSYDFLCELVAVLCIIALTYGLDVKDRLTNVQVEVKTRTASPADRPELPSTKRFVVPVDFVPEYILHPWKNNNDRKII